MLHKRSQNSEAFNYKYLFFSTLYLWACWGSSASGFRSSRVWLQLWVGFMFAHVSHFGCTRSVLSSRPSEVSRWPHIVIPGNPGVVGWLVPGPPSDSKLQGCSSPLVGPPYCICRFNQPQTVNIVLEMWLVESRDMEPVDMEDPLYSFFCLCHIHRHFKESHTVKPNVTGSEEACPQWAEL